MKIINLEYYLPSDAVGRRYVQAPDRLPDFLRKSAGAFFERYPEYLEGLRLGPCFELPEERPSEISKNLVPGQLWLCPDYYFSRLDPQSVYLRPNLNENQIYEPLIVCITDLVTNLPENQNLPPKLYPYRTVRVCPVSFATDLVKGSCLHVKNESYLGADFLILRDLETDMRADHLLRLQGQLTPEELEDDAWVFPDIRIPYDHLTDQYDSIQRQMDFLHQAVIDFRKSQKLPYIAYRATQDFSHIKPEFPVIPDIAKVAKSISAKAAANETNPEYTVLAPVDNSLVTEPFLKIVVTDSTTDKQFVVVQKVILLSESKENRYIFDVQKQLLDLSQLPEGRYHIVIFLKDTKLNGGSFVWLPASYL